MSDNATICPICGSFTRVANAKQSPPTAYGPYPQESIDERPFYERGYGPPLFNEAQTQPGYVPQPPQNIGYAPPPYNAASMYPPAPINITVINNPAFSNKNEGALITEVILSLFGIFGVGWIMGGNTTIGIVLLACSFLLYWPIMFGGTIFTLGFGLICLGPIAIAAIILNVLLLNNRLHRKATQYVMMQPPPMQVPPQPQ
jgi:hypothetical protein